jgi:protein SCO1/2
MKTGRYVQVDMRHPGLTAARAFLILVVFLPAFPAYARDGLLSADPPQRRVGIDSQLGAAIPLDLVFHDESNRRVSLRQWFGARPVLMLINSYQCDRYCDYSIVNLARALTNLRWSAGDEFAVVLIDFDPRADPAQLATTAGRARGEYGNRPAPSPGFTALRSDPATIRRLSDALGFELHWDEGAKRFAHGPALAVLSPSGRICDYFSPIDLEPLALSESLRRAWRGIPSNVHPAMPVCYDPASGPAQSEIILRVIRAISGVFAVSMLGFFGTFGAAAILRTRQRGTFRLIRTERNSIE